MLLSCPVHVYSAMLEVNDQILRILVEVSNPNPPPRVIESLQFCCELLGSTFACVCYTIHPAT